MNVAFVYDRVNKVGGAERVLAALHEIWPDAPLFTSVYNPETAAWADGFTIHQSFLDYVPWARRNHEFLPFLTPLAFESFSFDAYDVVISITSAEAKSIITKPHTLHICYCLTPTRYLWSGWSEYQSHPGLGSMSPIAAYVLRTMGSTLRSWDLISATRPDAYIAISQEVKKRIEHYYHRRVVDVIYPPVDFKLFNQPIQNVQKKTRLPYFLTVARFVGYKRLELLIDVFNKTRLPLVIIGQGREELSLRLRARENITFVTDHLTDQALVDYYRQCRAFIFVAAEDFGIVALEALSCGKPVIAFKESGMAETVTDGKTGVLFDVQSQESITWALKRFGEMSFDPNDCIQVASGYQTDVFKKNMKRTVTDLVHRYKQKGRIPV